MAEFKLGRIKFVWKGEWNALTIYIKDDVIKYGGKTYMCVLGHTASADFNTDLNLVPTRWNLMADGQRWRSDWTASTIYEKGDLVKYGGNVYLTITYHTSSSIVSTGLEGDADKWELFAEGFDWKNIWTNSTRYKVNDIVKYGGINYICITQHTSALSNSLGLEQDQSKWQIFSSGVDYKGTWSTGTRYKINDVVKYGAGSWICITYHTSSPEFVTDNTKWNQYVEGIEYESTWNGVTSYQPGDIVKYGGNHYISKTQHTNSNPLVGSTNWDLFSQGLDYKSNWDIATSYKIGEVVRVNGYNYVSSTDSPSYSISVTSSSSITDTFSTASTTNMIAGMAIRFTGTTFGNVFPSATYYVSEISGATAFKITNVLGGSVFNPTTGSGSMNATFAIKPPNASYWTLLSSGINWRGYWVDDTEYVNGDAVRYLNNSYVCKLAHRSDGDDGSTTNATGGGQSLSRPDQDIAGLYWSVLSVGSETATLQELGDLVYYDGAGPARLPIGTEGQILRVSADQKPEWVTWGLTDRVYWVGNNGTDLPWPTHGGTFDKPWKSIRYACEQIEKGARFPQAKRLLEMNRLFIQRETTQWINYQILNSITPFANSFKYREDRCERDIGWVIDALVYDLGHGGNVRTRGCALAYLNALSEDEQNGTGVYNKLSAESDEDVAAYNYMLSLITKCLSNQSPTTAYQTVAEDSTNIIPQWFDTTLVAETGALMEITNLVKIVTNALTDKIVANIPTRYAAFNTIHVLTGQFREVLPIIVPESTVVLGDEVRSTNAGPIGSLVHNTDVKYSVNSLGRLESIVGDIVTGTAVTRSQTNMTNQVIQVPLGQSAQRELSTRLVRSMQHRIDFLTAQTNMIFYTLPTGYGSTYLSGYHHARTLIIENKDFIKKEITSFIDYNYSGVKYSRTTCSRDVGYVVDALIYDLTYGGKTQSLNAALAYFDGPGTNLVTDSSEALANIAAYTRMKTVISQVITNTAVTRSTGNTFTQFRDSTNLGNGSLAQTFLESCIDLIINMLNANNTNTRPTTIVSTITGGNTFTTAASHGLSTGDVLYAVSTSPNGIVAGTKYFVLPAGLTAASFQLGLSLNGSNISVVNGTGLAISFYVETRPPLTNGVTTTTALINAISSLSSVVPQIQNDTIDYINTNYGNFTYKSSFCRRDIGFLVDAGYYDTAFGSNYWAIQNGLSYLRLQSSVVTTYQLDQELASIAYVKQQVATSLTGSSTAISRANACYDEIIDIISNGVSVADVITWSDPGINSNKLYAREQLQTNRTFIINTLTTWLIVNYNTVWQGLGATGQAKCQRDIGYSIDAFSYDIQYGGNLATRNVIRSLFNQVTGVSVYPDSQQKTASAAMYTQLGLVCGQVVRELYSGQDTSGNAASSTEQTAITTLAGYINIAIVADNAGSLPGESLPIVTWAAVDIQASLNILKLEKDGIVKGTLQYITDTFNDFKYNQAKCSRDLQIILDAVSYDLCFNTNHQTIKAAYSYLRATAKEVFTLNQKTVTREALNFARDIALNNLNGNTTAQTRLTSLMKTVDDIIFIASTEGLTCSQAEANTDYAIHLLELNKDFIVDEIRAYNTNTFNSLVTLTTTSSLICSSTSWMKRNAAIKFTGSVFGGLGNSNTYYIQNIISSTSFSVALTRDATSPLSLTGGSGTMTVYLEYDEDFCLRDVISYIDAIKFDLRYTGNYKCSLASRYYANAVKGSYEEDMYYLRNATGIRNQTLEGLTGDLLAPNAYGTSRVSAGAYCSLDPGFGPDDYHAWIVSRSPYIQNVATFGYAAIGQKVDGDLHNGGNKSLTSNDFTQIISDGIGAWITNNARAELVSVFTYYSHVGYLAENGGRIRGTNGNNSYGDFGSVAEGFDETETPILANVDNKGYKVAVGSTLGDGTNKVFTLEYTNAGLDYTYATWAFGGNGSGISAEQDEFRDGGVYQVRLTDLVDDSTDAPEALGNFGGFGYLTNSNVAQSGTTTGIKIAAVDAEIAAAYVGMRIVITSGSGAGQYAQITAYNIGTKDLTIIKESDGTAGWDHWVPGTTIVAPDASSSYTIEPRISFASPSYTSVNMTLSNAQIYNDTVWAETFRVFYPITGTSNGGGSGARFVVVKRAGKYSSLTLIPGYLGINYARLDTITIVGADVGGVTGVHDITITLTTVNSTNGSIIEFEYVGNALTGNFIALPNTGQTPITSSDGINWVTRTGVLPSSLTWTAMATGEVIETTPTQAGSFVVGRSYKITALATTQWTLIGHPAATNLQVKLGDYFIATGTGTGTGTATAFEKLTVAIANGSNATAYSKDGGVSWTAGQSLTGAATTNTAIAYGKLANGAGRWVVVKSGTTQTNWSTTGGVGAWQTGGVMPTASNWSAVTYGQGKWVAIANGSRNSAYSTDGGTTWTAGGQLPNVGTNQWTRIAYGNNRFIAISADTGTTAAYTIDGGVNWVSVTLSESASYTNISYGQGVFLAVNNTNTASSSEDGINWTDRILTRASGTGFKKAVHGNPTAVPCWVVVPSASTSAASRAVLGCRTKARCYVQDEKIYDIRIIEPGSSYGSVPVMTITDPNNIYEAPFTVRVGNGVIAQPSFRNRGTGYNNVIVSIDTGDGYANNYQSGKFIAVRRLTGTPQAGANVVFSNLPNRTYKLVQVLSLQGVNDGSIKAFLQISPDLTLYDSPEDGTGAVTRIRYSQVRLTGHDFLDIGTGSFAETNYPGVPSQVPSQANETVDNNGGRVFYTSTDQDGNFRVGELFTIEQSTGVATLNADAFNIAGLSELTLGAVTLGGTSATITEFSTDPFFTANSDSVVPTQRAIRSYIAAQIGGGGASINVNSVVAGFIEIAGTTISTTTGQAITMKANFNFTGGVKGLPIAWNYFLNN